LVENEDEDEDECVQQSKESGRCAYDNNKENEEYFESDGRTLPLCFAYFKLLKQNVNNVSEQIPSSHDVESEERSGLANEDYLPLCFSSFEWLKENHEKIEKFDKINIVKGHFPSPELDENIQRHIWKCFPSPTNDVVVQILCGLDMDEGSETPSMKTLRNEQTNYIEFQGSKKTVYHMIQSETHKEHKEVVVLFIKEFLLGFLPLEGFPG
jgi:hypothetical protein